MPDECLARVRPWREVAAELERATDSAKITALIFELERAFEDLELKRPKAQEKKLSSASQ